MANDEVSSGTKVQRATVAGGLPEPTATELFGSDTCKAAISPQRDIDIPRHIQERRRTFPFF
jgi:hypothetical protein